MTRDEFDAFVTDAQARGFTHVRVSSGLMPLESWRPYGVFSSNPGIEDHLGGFEWVNEYQARDLPAAGDAVIGVSGVWSFVDKEGEDVRAEQESNYLRGLGV